MSRRMARKDPSPVSTRFAIGSESAREKDFYTDRMAKVPVCGWKFERAARKLGFSRVAGLDEVGRGPMFGPVVAAAVILEKGVRLQGLTDSKQLTEKQR